MAEDLEPVAKKEMDGFFVLVVPRRFCWIREFTLLDDD